LWEIICSHRIKARHNKLLEVENAPKEAVVPHLRETKEGSDNSDNRKTTKMSSRKRNPIIAALDVSSLEQAACLARKIRPYVGAFKIGKELFVSEGPAAVRVLAEVGLPIFLDLKFHDIPNTVARAVAAAVRLGVRMLTLHCFGGFAMLRAAKEAAQTTAATLGKPAPLLLGVTVLTSLDEQDLHTLGVMGSLETQVLRLAQIGERAGLDGLVCSPKELPLLRPKFPRMQLVTPGIRPSSNLPISQDDQKRTFTPAEAIRKGADWIVIGRPIFTASDPATAAQKIWEEIQNL